MNAAARTGRSEGALRAVALVALVVGLVGIVRAAPLHRAVEALDAWVAAQGAAGVVVFGACYVVGALLFVPGAALTLSAGALFGVVVGTAVVSAASTAGAALAFLIARHLARSQVERAARRHPRFHAVDRAVGEGGWRVIALLRLSPIFPYSLGNYLFGLTAVRFLPYVVASWVAMLPGTLLYVYVGHAGRTLAEWRDRPRGVVESIFLALGLAATVVVTWYVTRLARAAARRSAIAPPEEPMTHRPAGAGWPWTTSILLAVGLLSLAGAVLVHVDSTAFEGLFGPPRVEMAEAYADAASGPVIDHGKLEALLQRHVDAEGWVDYEGLKKDSARLDEYLVALRGAPFADAGRDEKLAYLINAYNACTLRLVLDAYPVASIKDIPANRRWDGRKFALAMGERTLNEVEHEEIRRKFADPRVHFALNCASVGCPPLRREAYTGAKLEAQLDAQARFCHERRRWFVHDEASGEVRLTRIYDWYAGDFEQSAGSALRFAARYSPSLSRDLAAGRKLRTRWLEYDWRLNDVKHRS